jgi:hypothetical protein
MSDLDKVILAGVVWFIIMFIFFFVIYKIQRDIAQDEISKIKLKDDEIEKLVSDSSVSDLVASNNKERKD